MRSPHLLALVVGVNADYGGSFEPFPTCAHCLPASVHDAPGVGFSLSFSSGTAAAHFYNGTVKDIGLIIATPDYAALMARLATSPQPPPLSRWEKLRRSVKKKLGWPATPDVGVLGAMLASLRDDTATALGYSLDRVAVSHPPIQGLAEEDLWDALEYAALRPWLAADLPRPELDLPLPEAGAYPTQLSEARAIMAAHGQGLCEHFKDYWECQEDKTRMPRETVMAVGFTQADLRAEVVRMRSAFTFLQPSQTDKSFVDLEAGLGARDRFESEKAFWAHVTNRLQAFMRELPREFRLTTVVLAGENSTHAGFLGALKGALEGSTQITAEDEGGDAGIQALVLRGQGGVIDPAFASARGAAEYARRRQEAPIGCKEDEGCADERGGRVGAKRTELR